jgi:hypothetical protein
LILEEEMHEQLTPGQRRRAMKLLDGYLTEEEVAQQLGRTVRALMHWRRHGKGPPYVKMGYTVLYRAEAVRRWLEAQEVNPVRARGRS